MKTLEIDAEDDAGGVHRIEVKFDDNEQVHQLVERIDEDRALDVDGMALVEMAIGAAAVLGEAKVLGQIAWPATPIRLRRVCVKVHFETEQAHRNFPVNAKWARVHRWACKKFDVAKDACGHLELHEASAEGPVINERQEIGPSAICKVVWVVKPGPEPNG